MKIHRLVLATFAWFVRHKGYKRVYHGPLKVQSDMSHFAGHR